MDGEEIPPREVTACHKSADGISEADRDRRSASYGDKILKGRKPVGLPVEQPMKFELIVSLKAAKQIGLTIPRWTLMKADKVIR